MVHRTRFGRTHWTPALGVALLLTPPAFGGSLPSKDVAAPPAEFLSGALRLPDPARTGVVSRTAMVPVRFDRSTSGSWDWVGELPVEGGGSFSLMLLGNDGGQSGIVLTPPGGSPFSVRSSGDAARVSGRVGPVGIGGNRIEGEAFTVHDASPGVWTVRIRADAGHLPPGEPNGYLLFAPRSPYGLYAHLAGHDLLTGHQVGIVCRLYDARAGDSSSDEAVRPLVGVITKAEWHVVGPDGRRQAVILRADGGALDGRAGDGVFAGSFRATLAGDYVGQVTVHGTTPEGDQFLRTSQQFLSVIDPVVALTGTGQGRGDRDGRLRLEVGARVLKSSPGAKRVQVSAELWGTGPGESQEGSNGSSPDVPVCWLSRMVDVSDAARDGVLTLRCDPRWLAAAGAGAPLALRRVRVQDADTHIPMAQQAMIPIEMAEGAIDDFADDGGVAAVGRVPSAEMLMGPAGSTGASGGGFEVSSIDTYPPAAHDPRDAGPPCSQNTLHRVMLVHGYCSGGVWPVGDFDDSVEFADHDQNRTHDQFAQLIRAQGGGLKSFGIVAHSQGGAASLHLYTYYWSGLDYSTGSRLIQSVGTPYQGTPLAGDLAILGKIFGAGCGTNFDMTYDGAALWLSGIPSWARSRVYYHTTSFLDDAGFDYCNLLTDFFLDDPDDGVIEMSHGQLPGANNMGHTEGWCHTTDMRDPAQYLDYARNAVMNANANR